MEQPWWLLLLGCAIIRAAQCQSLQDGDTGNAIPIWGLSTEIHGGESQLCNKTFADANATGLFYVNPNVAQGPQPGQTASYNGSTLNSGLAITVYNPGFTNTSNASSSYSLWYNTNGANYSDDYTLGYDVCALSGYSFNYNTQLRGQSDNGSCLSALDQPCISAIESAVQQWAKWLTTPDGNTESNLTRGSLPGICRDLSSMLVNNMPAECSYFFQDKLDGLAWPLTSYGDSFQTGLYANCRLNGTWENALSFFNNASQSIYTSWIRSVTPLIFVWMPVADALAQTVITEPVAKVFCGHVTEIAGDSYAPPAAPDPTPVAYNLTSATSNNSTASNSTAGNNDTSQQHSAGGGMSSGAIAGVVIGVIAALALLAGLAFWLLRRKNAKTSAELAQGRPCDDPSELPGENEKAQLPANAAEGGKNVRAQLEGNEIRELDSTTMAELEAAEKEEEKRKKSDEREPVELPAS